MALTKHITPLGQQSMYLFTVRISSNKKKWKSVQTSKYIQKRKTMFTFKFAANFEKEHLTWMNNFGTPYNYGKLYITLLSSLGIFLISNNLFNYHYFYLYFLCSIMSYPATALAKTTGLVTTRPLRAGLRSTGQRRALSRIDITRINRMYSCNARQGNAKLLVCLNIYIANYYLV